MRETLIVIDMQNDFIDGTLGTKEAQAIVPNVAKKIKEYKDRGDKIIFTRDTHDTNYLNTPEGKKLPVEHCIYGTHGWEIADGLELVGLCTDICVVSNVLILKATFPNADITVDASCCAGVTPETHKAALETMKMCQIEVIGENNEV